MSNKYFLAVFSMCISGLILSACGAKRGVGIPASLPIVQATLPESLKSSAATNFSALMLANAANDFAPTLNSSTPLGQLKERLFSPGPTDFQYRLKMVDEEIANLPREACLDTEAKEWVIPFGDIPISSTLAKVYVQCKRQESGAPTIFYGKKDSFWYLVTAQVNPNFESGSGEPPTIGTITRISEDAQQVEVYQISVEQVDGANYASVTHILADRTAGVFEVSSGSSSANTSGTEGTYLSPGANYTGLGCGVQMKTNSEFVYAFGRFDMTLNCTQTDFHITEESPLCVENDLVTTATDCVAKELNDLSTVMFTQEEMIAAGAGDIIKAIIVDKQDAPL